MPQPVCAADCGFSNRINVENFTAKCDWNKKISRLPNVGQILYGNFSKLFRLAEICMNFRFCLFLSRIKYSFECNENKIENGKMKIKYSKL